MTEIINELGRNVVPVFLIGCVFTFFVLWLFAATVASIHKTARINRLKERMLEQGYSAADIARVVSASEIESDATSENRAVPPVKNRHPQTSRTLT